MLCSLLYFTLLAQITSNIFMHFLVILTKMFCYSPWQLTVNVVNICHVQALSPIFPCRLKDELLQCILKTVVRESCLLITKCQTVSKEDLQKLLSTVPVCDFHINTFKNYFVEKIFILTFTFYWTFNRTKLTLTDAVLQAISFHNPCEKDVHFSMV